MTITHSIEASKDVLSANYNFLFGENWCKSEIIEDLLKSEYMDNLAFYLQELYSQQCDFVYPKYKEDIFKALKSTDFQEIKVVIFGDEPIPNTFANGLAHGTYPINVGANGKRYWPATQRIIDSVLKDYNGEKDKINFDTTLGEWASQGVLLLNTSLVAQRGAFMKHAVPFRNFTRQVITALSEDLIDVIFVFTSNRQANTFRKYINEQFHEVVILEKGIEKDSSIFDDINEYLILKDGTGAEIKWF